MIKLQNLYQNKHINDTTFIWNGSTIPDWIELKKIPDLHKKLIQPPPPPKIFKVFYISLL